MLLLIMLMMMMLMAMACCSDRYRGEEASDYQYRGEEATDSLDRMKPEDVYDSIRRTTADIRHYVKMESKTASPPSGRPSSSASHRQDGGGSGAGAGAYHLPVVRSPDRRLQQRYNQVCYRGHVSDVNNDISQGRELGLGLLSLGRVCISYGITAVRDGPNVRL